MLMSANLNLEKGTVPVYSLPEQSYPDLSASIIS